MKIVRLAAFFVLVLAAAGARAEEKIVSHPAPYPAFGEVERLDPALDELLAPGVHLEKLAEGFKWSEGPVWMAKERQLIFSDIPDNVAYRWRDGRGIDVFLQPSGLTGPPNGAPEPGSNGLAVDARGRLLLAQHGDRRLARLNDDGKTFTTLVDRYEGKRFNSPNDLCLDRAGNIYFTDPPYGMGGSVMRELDFHGVYRWSPEGKLTLLTREVSRPNGIGLSPDEKTLYVANSEIERPVIFAYDLQDGAITGKPRVFFDGSSTGRRGVMDGMCVDARGNLWATGPGGVLIISAAGKHLGTLLTGRNTANCCFGGHTLYLTADDVLGRIETKITGR